MMRRPIPCPLRNLSNCPGELTPMIGMEVLNARAILRLSPNSKGLVGFLGLIFGAEEGNVHVARVVVCGGDK